MTWLRGGVGNRTPGRVRLVLVGLAALALAGFAANVAPAAAKDGPKSFVSESLLDKAKRTPNAKVRVIVQSTAGSTAAQAAVALQGGLIDGDHLGRRLGIVGGTAAEMKAKRIAKLAETTGLTVTPDVEMKASDFSSGQLWPVSSGNAQLWGPIDLAGAAGMPTIAIVDSGIDTSRPDLAGRVVASVDLTSALPNSPGDGRGHGTFVAGIAAGAAPGYAGAAPGAKLVSIDVLNDAGMAWTSDVIAAADWISQHKAAYNIRVANFSLNTSVPSSFAVDPLDQAVERLWFGGVVVVAAAGNSGEGVAGDVKYAPANDPFVITVGAADLAGTGDPSDDFAAPWSVFGYTYDGFRKPELGAPGRYMIGPVPTSATLTSERPLNVVAPGYMQLSGTSFAAPVVSGAAAHVLAVHPEYSPDQVKGALMVTARPTGAADWSLGVGEVDAVQAATFLNPPNPNAALNAFVGPDPLGGSSQVFNAASWNSTAAGSASWNSASWNSASWNSASWNSASWNSASWNSASWNSASWNSASWNSGSEAESSLELAATGDAIAGGYGITPDEAAALAQNPIFSPLVPLP
jgi:serine protease AprX